MLTPWFSIHYIKLERIAWRHGYCLALHGSMKRDLDLIAVPWVEDASSPEKLLKAFCKFVGKDLGIQQGKETEKPHGRTAYVIPIGHGGEYLDISVLPKKI